jgi:hypothetical protein
MSKKDILNTMNSLISQKHCLMCKHYVKSIIPKDKGTCLKLDEYPAYKWSATACGGTKFVLGGKNMVEYFALLKNMNKPK